LALSSGPLLAPERITSAQHDVAKRFGGNRHVIQELSRTVGGVGRADRPGGRGGAVHGLAAAVGYSAISILR
jgi:hypothetical protein